MLERLQKIISRFGGVSRRKAEDLIRQGKVMIDGQVVIEMGIKIDPEKHTISLHGMDISNNEPKVYILLNKPKGYLSTLYDPFNRPIVSNLLSGITTRVFPVGRLDLDTEGALLLTNDGPMSNYILHPRFGVNKTYVARVVGHPRNEDLKRLEQGILIDGKMTAPSNIHTISRKGTNTTFKITIHEGRKRQIKKMFAAIEHPVLDLKRIAYGGLCLGDLHSGKFRILDVKELATIFEKKNYLYNMLSTGLE